MFASPSRKREKIVDQKDDYSEKKRDLEPFLVNVHDPAFAARTLFKIFDVRAQSVPFFYLDCTLNRDALIKETFIDF